MHFVFGIAVSFVFGYFVCVVQFSILKYHKRSEWPDRRFRSLGRRDLLERARFVAFSKLFEFCKSDFEYHAVTDDDKARVYSMTRAFIGEDFEGRQIIAGDADLAGIAVNQAIDLFLKV